MQCIKMQRILLALFHYMWNKETAYESCHNNTDSQIVINLKNTLFCYSLKNKTHKYQKTSNKQHEQLIQAKF